MKCNLFFYAVFYKLLTWISCFHYTGIDPGWNYEDPNRRNISRDDSQQPMDASLNDFEIYKNSKVQLIQQENIYISKGIECPAPIFKVLDEYLIIADDNIMHIHIHADKQTFLELDSILPIVDEVRFIEVTQTKNIAFVLMSFNNGKANLYISYLSDEQIWSKFSLKQVISRRESNLVVAKFVTLGNDTYLVAGYTHAILYGSDVSIIYSWTGSYFDEINTIDVGEIVDVSISRKDKQAFLLMLARNSLPHQRTDILLYEYSSVDGLMRLSTFPTDGATMLFSYEIQNRGMQLLAVNNGVAGSLYEIKNNAFVPADFINLDIKVNCGFVVDYFQYPFILLGGENSIILFDTYDKKITTLKLSSVIVVTDLHVMETPIKGHFKIFAICRNEQMVAIRILDIIIKRGEEASSENLNTNKIKKLLEDLNKISQMLDERQNYIEDISKKIQEIRTIENVYYDSVLSFNHPVTIKNSVIENIHLLREDEDNYIIQMNESLNENEFILKNVESKMEHMIKKGRTLEIFEDVVFNGDIYINNFTSESVYAETLNNDVMSYEPVLLDEDYPKDLELRVFNLTVRDLGLLTDEELIIKSMDVHNLFIESGYSVNGINPNDIVTKDFNGIIEGQKTFHYLNLANLKTQIWNGVHLHTKSEKGVLNGQNVFFDGDIAINELYVDQLNGMNMKSFMSNVFQKGTHDKIKGNLTFVVSAKIENLVVNEYDGIRVEDLLTKTTPQNVTAKLRVRNMLLQNTKIGKVNGLNLLKDVAIIGQSNIITTPVTIGTVSTKNLILKCKNFTNSSCQENDLTNVGKLRN